MGLKSTLIINNIVFITNIYYWITNRKNNFRVNLGQACYYYSYLEVVW